MTEPSQHAEPIPQDHEGQLMRLAELLIEARASSTALDPVEPALVPASDADANAVDDLVASMSGRPVMGWKIGCTSEHAQAMLGADGPFAGRVYDLHDSGVVLSPDQFVTEPILEGEFAFTLASPLAPSDHGHTRDAVVAAVGSIRPAIEIVGGRFAAFVGTPLRCLIADSGANTRLILGAPVTDWEPEALASASATMTVDGEVTGQGHGADVLGDPITALVWLANHLSARSITIEAGMTVTTGTATQVSALPPGATATVSLAGVGSATVTRAEG